MELKQVYVTDSDGKRLMVKILDNHKLVPLCNNVDNKEYITTIYDASGNAINPRTLTSVNANQFKNAYRYNSSLKGDLCLDVLTNVDAINCFQMTFLNAHNITSVTFQSLVSISGDYAFASAFQMMNGIKSIDFTSLKTVTGYRTFASLLAGCPLLTNVGLPNLETIDGEQAFMGVAASCDGLKTITFQSLSKVDGDNACRRMLMYDDALEDVFFPSLNTNSFGNTYTNQFTDIILNCNNVTIHFPSNLQNVISNLDTYPNFGGTGTVVLFDLPATS